MFNFLTPAYVASHNNMQAFHYVMYGGQSVTYLNAAARYLFKKILTGIILMKQGKTREKRYQELLEEF